MKKIAAAVIVLCIGLTIAYVFFFRDVTTTPTIESVDKISVDGVGPQGEKVTDSGVGTLRELAGKGTALECQVVFERSEEEGVIEGTYFTANNNIRADFMIPAPEYGGQIVSSMIVSVDSLYVWSVINGETFGFKSQLSSQKPKTVETKEPVPLDASVQYSCTKWESVDGSVFIPPATVSFKDTDSLVEGGMEYGN